MRNAVEAYIVEFIPALHAYITTVETYKLAAVVFWKRTAVVTSCDEVFHNRCFVRHVLVDGTNYRSCVDVS